MNERQMIYLYMYGCKSQLETVKSLADLALEKIDQTKVADLLGLIRWVMDYEDHDSYAIFFMEFCMAVDNAKEDFSIPTIEAIQMQKEYYGKDDEV